ncbi:hypothetical protein FKW77_001757 [Venturia effusa]|uniref:Uncharacterized protein n=1 Tax=Venturia effusa TaxID=50376 RepID=A0A517LJQ3_9PEZI|nr:hypothetical protein FKW77_001757 [Venturia effusa]
MAPPYDQNRGRGRGGYQGNNPRGGPRGGSKNGPRGGGSGPYGGGWNGYGQGIQNHAGTPNNQITQGGGYWDRFGNWISHHQPFSPYMNPNGYEHLNRSKQWNHPDPQKGPQQGVFAGQTNEEALLDELHDLQTKYNKSQGQYLAKKDEIKSLYGENSVLKKENEELTDENAELRATSESLIKNVKDFGKLLKELEVKNKLLKRELDKARGKEVGAEDIGEERADSVALADGNTGFSVKGAAAEKIKGIENLEVGTKLVPAQNRARGEMKNSSEAMKALIETEAKAEAEAEVEANKESEATVFEANLVKEVDEQEWAPDEDEDEIDFDVLPGVAMEDEIDYGFDDLNEAEETMIADARPVETKMKKRKASDDEGVDVAEKKEPKRGRHRK